MAVLEIILFGANPSLDESTTVDEKISKALEDVSGIPYPKHSIIGTRIQHKGSIQITSEWKDAQHHANFATSPEFSTYIKNLSNTLGEPQNIYHIIFNRSAFEPNEPATANVLEFAQSYFPASRITPDFQAQIEREFSEFNRILCQGAIVKGRVGQMVGWVLEEQDHEEIKGEKAKCFVVMTGWESMEDFEKSIDNDAFKEALPILLA